MGAGAQLNDVGAVVHRAQVCLGRAVTRAAESVQDRIVRWADSARADARMRAWANVSVSRDLQSAPLARSPRIVSGREIPMAADRARREFRARAASMAPQLIAAAVVGIGAIVADVLVGGAVSPILGVGADVAIAGIATYGVVRVARDFQVDARVVLASAIVDAERAGLCTSYGAEAWRLVCRLPRGRTRRAAFDFARAGATTLVCNAATHMVEAEQLVKLVPGLGTVLRAAAHTRSTARGVWLVARMHTHAERSAKTTRRRLAIRAASRSVALVPRLVVIEAEPLAAA